MIKLVRENQSVPLQSPWGAHSCPLPRSRTADLLLLVCSSWWTECWDTCTERHEEQGSISDISWQNPCFPFKSCIGQYFCSNNNKIGYNKICFFVLLFISRHVMSLSVCSEHLLNEKCHPKWIQWDVILRIRERISFSLSLCNFCSCCVCGTGPCFATSTIAIWRNKGENCSHLLNSERWSKFARRCALWIRCSGRWQASFGPQICFHLTGKPPLCKLLKWGGFISNWCPWFL